MLWLIGIPASELGVASHLMATKTVLNEFVAYLERAPCRLRRSASAQSSFTLCVLRLCQFRQHRHCGLTAMAPSRRHEIVAPARSQL
ncbi:MAG: hypothetical protein FWC84_07845 [Alphaproteobacteria bacterium]|nr:hypothetical protein [Alphaproteobacteria bacterium]